MSSGPDPEDLYGQIKKREQDLKADSEPDANSEGLELSVQESLQSIAVEFHRANLLKQQELRYQERQNDLLGNVLDLLRKPVQTAQADDVAESMREFTRAFMEPIQALLGEAMRPKAPKTESLPAGPAATVELEKNGTRVTQDPDPEG